MDGLYQGVHFISCIIKCKGCTGRSGNTVAFHHRLCTMMPGTDGYTMKIEYGADIMRVYTIQNKTQHRSFFAELYL